MSVLDRLKNKGTNSGWLGETLERARQQREAEEEQKKQNRAKQATNKDFIGPSQEVYTQPQTVPNLLAMTKEQREASAQQGISDVVQSLNRPRKTPLDELREDGSVMTKPGMYTLSKAMQGVGNSVAGMIGAAEGVKDYAQYVLNGRKTPEPLPQLGTRPDPMEAYRDWTEFNTILSNAEQQYVSPARQLYGNVVQGVSGMIFPMATASVTGGMGLVTGISAGGNAAMDAKLQGYNPVESLARGLLTGAVQGAATSALTDKTLGRVLKPTAGNGMKRFLANQGKMMLSEGIEEAIEEPAQLGIDALTLGKMPTAEDWQALPRQMLQSGITGALVGGAMGLPANMIGATAPRNSDTQTDSWTERYRDTQLQQPQNRGTINQTEVALDGQEGLGQVHTTVNDTGIRRTAVRNDAGGIGAGESTSQTGSGINQGYDAGRERRMVNGANTEAFRRTAQDGAAKEVWKTRTGKQLTFQQAEDTQLDQSQQAARENANARGFDVVYFDGQLEAYNADGTPFRTIDDGTVDGNTIFVRRDSKYPVQNVVDHESTHGIKRLRPESYETLSNTVNTAIYPVEFDQEINNFKRQVKEAYGAEYSDDELYDFALEETLANLSYQINEDTPPSYVADVDAVKQAYDVFFNSLGTKVSQQESTQQAAEMDTGNSTDTRLEQQAGVQPDLQQAKETIAQFADKTGRKVVWYNDQSNPDKAGTNGYMENGVLYINENAQNPYMEVFKHELFHSLPADAKQDVIDFFRTNVNEDTPAFREFKAREMQRQRQKNLRYSDADFWEEYAAQNAEFLLEEGYIEQIVKTDRNLAQKILDAIKRLLERIQDIFAPGDYSGAVSTHESGRVSGLNDTRLRQAQRLYERALNGAGKTMDGMKYSFAGPKAQQADMSALQRAQQMETDGAAAEDILRETGWFTGLDGKWRFELDDSQMRIDYDGMKQKRDTWLNGAVDRLLAWEPQLGMEEARRQVLRDEQMPLTLGDVLDYPELYRQYPDMADMPVRLYDSAEDYAGFYNPEDDAIVLTRGGMENVRQTLVHEIQHAIQRREGFDMGASPEGQTDAETYWNTAGEIEAREAGRRQGMTADERRESLPMKDVQNAVLSDGSKVGPRYSIETLPDGKRYVQADRKVITSNNPDDWGREITDYINQKIRNGEDVAIPTEDGDVVLITEKTAWKMADRHAGSTRPSNEREYLSDADYRTKANAAGHIDELLEVSKKTGGVEPDKQGKHGDFAKDGWQSRIAYFMDGDGQYYRMRISTAQNDNGTVAYNIGQIQRRSKPNRGGNSLKGSSVENNGARAKSASSVTDSIPQDSGAVNTSIRSGEDENTKYSMKRSQFYDSLQEADTVDDKVKQGVAEQIDAFGYQPIANEQTMKKASEQISKDPEKRAVRFLGLDGKHATTDDVAEGFLLLKQYQDDGDYESAVEVAKKLAALGTEAGRNVQIYSVLERLTPEGMLKYATSELEKVKTELEQRKKSGKLVNEKYIKNLDMTAEEAQWITDTMTRVQAMPDGRDRAVLLGEIQKRIQQKIPSGVGEKIRALQRISLLLNPKTVISRNMLSNAIMNPFWTASDFIASGIDKAVGKATGMRTTGLPSYRQQASGMKKGAYESFDDFRRGINTRDAAADNFKIGKGSAFKGSNKLSKTLAALDRTTSFLLDIGDRPFFEGYFLESLNGQMKANKVTQPTADMIDIARQTALEKTWQDDNAVTRSAQKIRDGLNFGKEFGLGSIIVPFVKTPSNIAKAIVEFSPAGVAKGLVYDGNKLLRAVKNGTSTAQQQRAFVNNVAKGMTGTIMYMLAGVLAANGLLTGSDDEKDKDVRNFKRNIQGIMQNSIKIGGKSYSYDWAQPIGGILTTMADIQNQTYSKENMINTLTQAMTAGGNTLFEQSMLSGLSDFFGNYDGFMTSLVRAFVEAPSQFLPTLGKQIAEAIDPVARRTQGNGLLDTAGNRMLAKIPGATKKLEPVVDVLGRDVMRYGGKNSLFNIFLNPANVNIANPTPVTTEVWRLYEQTGDTTVFPRVAPSSFTDDGTKYEMTDKEQTQFQRTMGQEADRLIQKLMDSAKYQNADDAEKAELVADAVEESYDKAKKELIESRGGTPSKRLKKVGDSK